MNETLANITIIAGFILVGVFGYYIMDRLDKFLKTNQSNINSEKKISPACVFLTEHLSDEEALNEIMEFRKEHKNASVVVYDSSDTDISKAIHLNSNSDG